MGSREIAPVGRRKFLRRGGAVAAGALGATVLASGIAQPASAVGFTYTPIVPYRSLDTRGTPKLTLNEFFDIDLVTDEFGNPAIASNVAAVTYNMTVTQTQGSGFLTMWPADADPPNVSNINWSSSGLDLANGGTVKLGTSPDSGAGSVSIFCGGLATHLLIDVTGYYA
jgi:hypothetical protein